MTKVPDGIYLCECPGCGNVAEYIGIGSCCEDWNGETYRFKCCGRRAHLDFARGGARCWVEPKASAVA